jgi:hypothetical protein
VRLTVFKLRMFRFSYSRVQTWSRPHQHRRAHVSRFLLSWLHSSPETRSSCSTKRIYSRHPLWHQQRSKALSYSTAGRSASLRMLARMSSWQDLPQLYRRGKATLALFLFSSNVVVKCAHVDTIFKMPQMKRRELLLSHMRDTAPTWNPLWGSWTPFWRRVVRCGFLIPFDFALSDSRTFLVFRG